MVDFNLRVDYRDQQLRAWARDNPARVQRLMRTFLLKAGQLAVGEMKRVARERFGRIGVRHPGLGPPTGQLAATIRASAPTRTHVDISPNVPYEAAVDTGSRPHVILPRRAKALRWTTRGGPRGGVMFARRVQHPGFRGHFYVRRTADRIRPRLDRLMRALIQREVTNRR